MTFLVATAIAEAVEEDTTTTSREEIDPEVAVAVVAVTVAVMVEPEVAMVTTLITASKGRNDACTKTDLICVR